MSDVTITSVSAERLLELLEKSPDSLELLQKLMRYFKEKN